MNIFEYVKSLFGSVDKRDVLSEIDRLTDELSKFTIVGYKQAVAQKLDCTGPNYYCKQMTRLYADIRRENHLRAVDPVEGVYLSLEQLTLTLVWLRRQIEKEYGNGKMAANNLDFKQSNFLRYIDAVSFYLGYARSMLLVVSSIKCEDREADTKITDIVVLEEAKFLTNTANYFCYLIGIFSQPIKVTEKLFDAIPTVVVSETDRESIEMTMGTNAVDPMRSNFIPLKYNIFYRIGRRRAEKRVLMLREAEAAARAIELTLAKLAERKANGDEDPSIDKQIDFYKNELNKLQAQIETITAEANIQP